MNHKKVLFAAVVAMATLSACQKEVEHFMTLSDKALSVGYAGGKVSVTLASNVYYRVNNDIEWATISMGEQKGDSTVFVLDVKENTSFDARTSQVRFIGDYVTPLKLVVTQKGTPKLGVEPNEIKAQFYETSASVNVYSDEAWTAKSSDSRFTIEPASGYGDGVINVTFPENLGVTAYGTVITMTTHGKDYTCMLTQSGKVATNLAEGGKTANCYIVSNGGLYKFPCTVRGTGFEPESSKAEVPAAISPKGAKVLWCTYNTTVAPESVDAIIKNVELSDGFIFFETASSEFVSANVIIAAYDDAACNGNILWSWHIWLTDTPAEQSIGDYKWLDRQLGATCANIEGDTRSIGLFYQWGRKDPMRTVSSYTMGDFIATCPAFTVDEVNVSETTGTISASIANPMPFINTFPGGSGPKDWIFNQGNTDRWQDANKTMFDPCPVGYRVPSSSQLVNFGEAGGIPSGSQKGDCYKNAYMPSFYVFKTAAWSLPLGGLINYNDGTKVGDYGIVVRLETSTWNKTANTLYLNCNGSACNFANNATAGHAAGIRCVKE